jgi:hypothetical protein
MPRSSRRALLVLSVGLLPLAVGACLDASVPQHGAPGESEADRVIARAMDQDPELGRALQEIRAATERFRDVEVAVEAGYMRDPMDMCVTPEMEGYPRQLGGMGIHYFRPDLLAITDVEPRVAGMGTQEDFREPGVLVYEPQPDGSLELVAVENLIFEAGWRAAGREGVPDFMGNQYYHLVNNPLTEVDEAHGFEPHYELHMWLYRENPAGLFAPFNTRVTCEHHQADGGGHAHPGP